jgi:hypothetical protein
MKKPVILFSKAQQIAWMATDTLLHEYKYLLYDRIVIRNIFKLTASSRRSKEEIILIQPKFETKVLKPISLEVENFPDNLLYDRTYTSRRRRRPQHNRMVRAAEWR